MTLIELIGQLAAAFLVGAATAWWLTRQSLVRDFNHKLRQLTETHRKHHEVVVDKLNASHAAAKRELENQRNTQPRPAAASLADQRSANARLEEQLKAAYVELDRLRLAVMGPAPEGRPAPPNGFADTQPFIPPKKGSQR